MGLGARATKRKATEMRDAIAAVIDHASLTADRAQDQLYRMILNGNIQDLSAIITGDGSDVTIGSDTTISGITTYKDLTINSGYTLTVDGQPGVIIARDITNNGTITKTPTGGDGGSGALGAGNGGKGGGALIICALSYAGGTVNANGEQGQGNPGGCDGSSDVYIKDGGAGNDGADVTVVSGDSLGDGGSGAEGASAGTPGGGGGGTSRYGSGGSGGTTSVTIKPKYITVYNDTWKAAVDHYLTRQTPSKPPKFPSSTMSFGGKGSGGGGGGCNNNFGSGGGGGGSAAQLIAALYDVDGGTFNCNGGDGGDSGSEGSQDGAGGEAAVA